MVIALGAAMAGAVAYGVGSVLQGFAALHATRTAVLKHPAYLMGVGCDILAFGASFFAVRSLPLFTVQSVLAGSLGVTVVLARVVLGTRIRHRDAAAIVGVVVALVVLALASGTQSARPPPSWFPAAALLLLVGAAAFLVTHYRRGNPNLLALLAGVSFAGSAIGARALDVNGAWLTLLGHPIVWTIGAFGLIGSLAYARSLECGSAASATATVWVAEVAVASVVGIGVLGDRVLAGWSLPALCATGAAILGCVVLAGSQPLAAQTRERQRE